MVETVPAKGKTYKHNSTGATVLLLDVNGSNALVAPTKNQAIPRFSSGKEMTIAVSDLVTNYTRSDLITNPANTVAPVITGVPKVGVVLSCTDGTWTGEPTPTLTRQWKVDGVAVTGETKDFYIPVGGDVDKPVTVTVTGTNQGSAVSATSSATDNVAA